MFAEACFWDGSLGRTHAWFIYLATLDSDSNIVTISAYGLSGFPTYREIVWRTEVSRGLFLEVCLDFYYFLARVGLAKF